jgi:peptidyl-prolyl cis-trans isomerase B (cyclophilin B)
LTGVAASTTIAGPPRQERFDALVREDAMMAGCRSYRSWAAPAAVALGLVLGLFLEGCGKHENGPDNAAVLPADLGDGSAAAPSPLRQPFADATITEPAPDGQWLPAKTRAGKSVGKLYLEVVRLWDSVAFTTPAGKRLRYTATVETELGRIEIALRPDLAPNHVRNFVALAGAGYYDGLVFERTLQQESEAKPGEKAELVEAGCPLGAGQPGYGSIGYWLKPEFSAQAAHEAGTVGAWHDENDNTAACKFYITLCRMPDMDGHYTVFGKVAEGLDVARKILSQPVRNDPDSPEGDIPEKPVVIKRVTIHTMEER